MPPKFKFTKEEIVEAAFTIVRSNGWNALTTRSLADELGSSSKPIYSFFNSMEELDKELAKRGVDLLHDYMTRERTGDPWQDHGIGYVMFAQEEKHLFLGLNDEKRVKYFMENGETSWKTITASLSDYPPFQGLTEDQVFKVQVTRWLMAHGLAFQVSNPLQEVWDDEKIVKVMQLGSTALLDGLKKQFFSTEG